MSDDIRVPFPKLVHGLLPYESRKSLPERLALNWFREPCSELVHPHMEEACARYGFEIGSDSFRAALSIYGPLYIVTTLLTKRHPGEILRRAVPAIFRSSIFFGVFTFLYSRFACFLFTAMGQRNYRVVFWLSPFIMSMLAINIEKSTRRRELAVYMANQTAETLFKMLLSRGWFIYTPFRTGKRLLFATAVALLHLFYNWSPSDLAPSVHALLQVLAGTKCQNSAADWIEKRVRIVTTPILRIASPQNRKGSFSSLANGGSSTYPSSNSPLLHSPNSNSSPAMALKLDTDEIQDLGGLAATDLTLTPQPDHQTDQETSDALESQEPAEAPSSDETGIGSQLPVAPSPTLPDTIEQYVAAYSKSRIMFTINGFVRGFLIGYVVRAVLAFGPKLFNPASFIKNARRIMTKAFGKGAFDFGLFVSLVVGVPRLVKVLLTKLFGREHPLIDAAAGFVGGCCGSVLHSSTEVTLYIASKATEALVECGARNGKLPTIPFFVETLYSFSTATLFYAGSMEPWTVRKSYRKFLAKGSGWHYGRFSESDGCRGLRESSGMNQLHRQYLTFKKES
jgi:hypothetical protein